MQLSFRLHNYGFSGLIRLLAFLASLNIDSVGAFDSDSTATLLQPTTGAGTGAAFGECAVLVSQLPTKQDKSLS